MKIGDRVTMELINEGEGMVIEILKTGIVKVLDGENQIRYVCAENLKVIEEEIR